MLPTTLNTNEVKNAAGTEVEFQRRGVWGEDGIEFSAIAEVPNREHRIRVGHRENGTGIMRVRESVIQVFKIVDGTIDLSKTAKIMAQLKLTIPIGNISDYSEVKNVVAELGSFTYSLGATTTILFDGTGNGAAAVINGLL